MIFDNIDKTKETAKTNSPLLWYLLDTTSSEYNKALKKKLINNPNIYYTKSIDLIL